MEMLRSINPNEAKLLDVAAGGYVRFRLDGVSFYNYSDFLFHNFEF